MPSHLIPLIALAKLLRKSRFKVAFFVPEQFHAYVRSFNFTVLAREPGRDTALIADGELEAAHEAELASEVSAITRFEPHVLVDDLNICTAFSSRLTGKARISVVRKGVIPCEEATRGYCHSSGIPEYFDRVKETLSFCQDLWHPRDYYDLFKGDVNIIPSIPAIEALPPLLEDKSSYLYAGPLIIDDHEMIGPQTYTSDIYGAMDFFCCTNANRKLVYFTVGLAQPDHILKRAERCIQSLLAHGAAIFTNMVNLPGEAAGRQSRLFSSAYLPMHYICARADLMVHQCGSGTYGYQLRYELPGIALGSKCYDRDDVAIQLDALGASCYISEDLGEDAYAEKFNALVDQLLDSSSRLFAKQKAALAKIKKDTLAVQQNFSFEAVVQQVVHAWV
jgi:UDP:flavonoid glycosyltransferase YjiC (YdhE family)